MRLSVLRFQARGLAVVSRRSLNQRIFRSNVRRFSEDAAKKDARPGSSQTPPLPPKPEGGGSGVWILLTAALLGGGYYFFDEIKSAVGMGSEDEEEKAIKEAKEVIPKVEEKIKEGKIIDEKPVQKKAVAVQNTASTTSSFEATAETSEKADWKAIREVVTDLLENENAPGGSYGPVLVRLAWHSAGTYDKNTKTGGTEGAGMRFAPEADWGANAGLNIARNLLEPVKAKFPEITYSDLWSFAGTVAIEEMGGPEMKWRAGRKDYVEGQNVLPDGLLPDADGRDTPKTPQDHVRKIFGRMGFNDQEMVALIGAHALGRCSPKNSGYVGPWTNAPTTFSNEFFRLLIEETWTRKQMHDGKRWEGPEQYEDSSKQLMMLPADLCLVKDEKFKKYVELYAKDEDKFMKDFAKAWMKLQENGVRRFHAWPKYIFFGPRE